MERTYSPALDGLFLLGTLSNNAKQLFKHFVKKKKVFPLFLAEIKLWVLIDIVLYLHCQSSKVFFILTYWFSWALNPMSNSRIAGPSGGFIHPVFQLIFPEDLKDLNQVVRSLDALCHSHNQPSATTEGKNISPFTEIYGFEHSKPSNRWLRWCTERWTTGR